MSHKFILFCYPEMGVAVGRSHITNCGENWNIKYKRCSVTSNPESGNDYISKTQVYHDLYIDTFSNKVIDFLYKKLVFIPVILFLVY